MRDELDFIPYSCQDINESDINSVVKVLKSPFLTQGPLVKDFEEAIANKVNSKYSVATNSATSSLHLACLALGLKEGDIIWTSPITFVASANCGLYCGAKVDFVDIEPTTGLISIIELEKKLQIANANNNLPKILIPVHLCGTSCEMKEISNLSHKYGFKIIEDASHAIGGKYCSEYVGNCKYSDITVFSFHPVKIITTGEGGIATTNNKEISQKMQDLRSHGITKDKTRFLDKPQGQWSYEQQDLGFNYRLTDIHAALGLSQLKRLDEFIKKRNTIREFYIKQIKSLPIKSLLVPQNIVSSCHLFVIKLDNKEKEFHSQIFTKLREANIGVQLHYSAVHLQPYFKRFGFKKGDFPNAELYSRNAISLPIYTKLSIDKQKRVVNTLRNLLLSTK